MLLIFKYYMICCAETINQLSFGDVYTKIQRHSGKHEGMKATKKSAPDKGRCQGSCCHADGGFGMRRYKPC